MQKNRRKFLKTLGLGTGVVGFGPSVWGQTIEKEK